MKKAILFILFKIVELGFLFPGVYYLGKWNYFGLYGGKGPSIFDTYLRGIVHVMLPLGALTLIVLAILGLYWLGVLNWKIINKIPKL